MAEFDHGIKLRAQMSGQQLAHLAGVQCQEWTALESTVQVTAERLADRVFRARQGAGSASCRRKRRQRVHGGQQRR